MQGSPSERLRSRESRLGRLLSPPGASSAPTASGTASSTAERSLCSERGAQAVFEEVWRCHKAL